MKPLPTPQKHRQRGLGAIAAIVILVVLAALAAALLKLGVTQQLTSAQDVMSARAWAAARAGNEWGLFQAFKGGWTNCNGASQTLDLSTDTGFWVTVTCSSMTYNEGESVPGTAQTVRIYQIESTACNMPTATPSCPNDASAAAIGYVERRRQVIATDS